MTVCAFERQGLFGELLDNRIELSAIGRIVSEEWLKSLSLRRELNLDRYVVMPDHMHGIVIIKPVGAHGCAPTTATSIRGAHKHTLATPTAFVGAHGCAPASQPPQGRAHSRAPLRRPRSLSSFIAQFKAAVTVRVNAMRNTPGEPVWQRGYYEHVIRDERELTAARQYICNNPTALSLSQEYPAIPEWEQIMPRR
jgi:REP element-mobilizing transposase RayT